MNAKFLNAVLGQRSKLEALRCLWNGRQELSGREIARRAGLSHFAIHKALADLVAAGVVERRAVPPTHLFQLNRKHWIVDDILVPMFDKEAAWLEALERELKHGLPPNVATLAMFGSAGKGAMAPGSDIDILVLLKEEGRKREAEDHLDEVGGRVFAAFGHPLSAVVMSEAEFRARYRKGDRFAKEIAYGGRVTHGKLLTEVLGEDGSKKDG